MSDIYKLLDEVSEMGNRSPEYMEKMVHPIPKTEVKDRGDYIILQALGRKVVDFGASGPLAQILKQKVAEYHPVDISPCPDWADKYYYEVDVEKDELPQIDGVELVVAGETLEHLSNPGIFLEKVKMYNAPLIITVPNAYSIYASVAVSKGYENVNKDHVCWYSYQTLKTLITRHGWTITHWFWYNGKPGIAEGLIFHLEIADGEEKPIT